MLRVTDNKTGYFGVTHQLGKPKPYKAKVRHGANKRLSLGCFATAEEAALCVARSPEGEAAAQRRAAMLTSEEARQQAQAEGLALLVARETKTGYYCVHHHSSHSKPYEARVRRGGKDVHLGSFATAEQAALCIARSPEGQAAAQRAAAPPPLTSEEARQQAQAEGLTLRVADNTAGFFGVHHKRGRPKPYQAKLWRGGKEECLGSFATAEEAALCVARSPEGQASAGRVEVAPLTSKEARQQAQAEGLRLLVAENTTGYFGVHLGKPGRPKAFEARVRRGGKEVYLGSFATAEEGALYVARSLGEQAAARRAAAPPLTREDALQQARDTIIGAVALDAIYEAAGAAAEELSAEVAAEVMAGIAMGL